MPSLPSPSTLLCFFPTSSFFHHRVTASRLLLLLRLANAESLEDTANPRFTNSRDDRRTLREAASILEYRTSLGTEFLCPTSSLKFAKHAALRLLRRSCILGFIRSVLDWYLEIWGKGSSSASFRSNRRSVSCRSTILRKIISRGAYAPFSNEALSLSGSILTFSYYQIFIIAWKHYQTKVCLLLDANNV